MSSRVLDTAELPDLLPGGSAVKSEAGTLSGQSGQYAPEVKAEGNFPPASGFVFDVPPSRACVDAGASSPHCAAASDGFTVAQSSKAREARGELDRRAQGLPLTFSFTESQRAALAFAALCEAEELEEGDEADELEVQEAVRNLWEAHHVLNGRPL